MVDYPILQETDLDTVKILAETIEAKDPYTRGHCNRVRILSLSLAHHCGMGKEEIEILEYGALLHDIGKIGIKENLLKKTDLLTDEEMQNFQLHTVIGENILKNVPFFIPCLRIIRNHHEWYNGNGYPDNFRGEEIDLSARIVSISDAFDAMTSTRPYHKALPIEYALSELIRGKRVQFDPDLVDIFIKKNLYFSFYQSGKLLSTGS